MRLTRYIASIQQKVYRYYCTKKYQCIIIRSGSSSRLQHLLVNLLNTRHYCPGLELAYSLFCSGSHVLPQRWIIQQTLHSHPQGRFVTRLYEETGLTIDNDIGETA